MKRSIFLNGIFFVAGVYGVGKSTLCKSISKQCSIPYYSAGTLIGKQVNEIYGKNKKVEDKGKNQQILIECVENKLLSCPNFLLDGHFYIMGEHDKPDEIPKETFNKLNIAKIILLESDCRSISNNLKKRDGKEYSSDIINNLLQCERQSAISVSETLHVPLLIHEMEYSNMDIIIIKNFVEGVQDESIT